MRDLRAFLDSEAKDIEEIYNEHALQLELAIHLRLSGYRVRLELPFTVKSLSGSTRKPKRELDIWASDGKIRTAIELKVPLQGRVPETMYDFCADVEFVESIIRAGEADRGYCLLVSNDRQFWYGKSLEQSIYRFFRQNGTITTGEICKPTGARDTSICLAGFYDIAACWCDLKNTALMPHARYLLVEVGKGVL